jgi:predicted kinase
MCRGLPASGKTTWAHAQLNSTVVDSDDIRARMGGFAPETERLVQVEKLSQIRRALIQGQTVISSDPNLQPKYESELRRLARRCKATFEVRYFDTPVEECIRRDSLRTRKVGADVIRRLSKDE